MVMDEPEKLKARIAILNYSRNKISEHIQYVISIILTIFTLYRIIIIDQKIINFISIFLLGPLFYMLGRIIYWSTFTNAVIIVKPCPEKDTNINCEFEEYNLLRAYNISAGARVGKESGNFGRIARRFSSSVYLFYWTILSLIVATIHCLCSTHAGW